MIRFKWVILISLVATFSSALCGCSMLNRGVMHYHRNTTIGQELMDLKEAKEKKAISDQEYLQIKDQILSGSSFGDASRSR